MLKQEKKSIEIEFRSRFSKEKYDQLMEFLLKNTKDLGVDDKRVWFYCLPDKLLKVTHNISAKSGKITLKLTKIGKGTDFEEIEYFIEENSVEPAIKLFNQLGYKYLLEPEILRHNFEYKGVEIALKYSQTWGYHLELEVHIEDLKDKTKAEKKIFEIAEELQISLMSEEELWEFTQKIEKTYYKCPKP